MSAQEMTTERLAAIRAELDACIDGGRGFLWGPCHPEGGFDSPEEASAYVANLVRRSVEAADDEGAAKRARELWGVFVNREDESLFVCHTGNGPTSEAHARFIAGAPYSVHSLLDHVDALTADRDEARQEVAALRAQRDEIREAHRVDEEERDSDALRRMATLAVEAQKKLSTLTEAVAWYLELRARDAGSNGAQAEGYANTLRAAHDDLTSLVDGEPATARAAHLDTLTARLEAAERERETNAERCLEALDDIAKLLVERNAAQARADAAEAKLAALVEAATAVCEWDPARLEGNLYAEGLVADLGSLRNATKAARGPA